MSSCDSNLSAKASSQGLSDLLAVSDEDRSVTQALLAPRRIAIFRALNLGDMLLAVPALRAVRRIYPQAEITLISLPWVKELTERYRHYIDRFVEFPGFPGIEEAPYDERRTSGFLQKARSYSYDIAIQLHGSGRTSNAFVRELGARVTVGAHPGREDKHAARLDIQGKYPAEQSEVLRTVAVARLLFPGIGFVPRATEIDQTGNDPDLRLEFPLWPEDHRAANRILTRAVPVARPLVVIHPSARAPERRWASHRFAQLSDALFAEMGATIAIVGAEWEKDIGKAVVQQAKSPVLNAAGETSLGTLGALISRADLFIGNDSGPAHLADAVNTPSVTLFASADPSRWGSLDQRRHRVLRRLAQGTWRIDAIAVEDVLQVSREMLTDQLTGAGSRLDVAENVS